MVSGCLVPLARLSTCPNAFVLRALPLVPCPACPLPVRVPAPALGRVCPWPNPVCASRPCREDSRKPFYYQYQLPSWQTLVGWPACPVFFPTLQPVAPVFHCGPVCCREDSPESFHHELENVAWEESLRGCAEHTYLALFEVCWSFLWTSEQRGSACACAGRGGPGVAWVRERQAVHAARGCHCDPALPCNTAACTPPAPQSNREAVAPVVVQLLKAASEACPPGAAAQLAAGGGAAVRGIPAPLLAKEAAYQAVAAGAYELHDFVDFTGVLGAHCVYTLLPPALG